MLYIALWVAVGFLAGVSVLSAIILQVLHKNGVDSIDGLMNLFEIRNKLMDLLAEYQSMVAETQAKLAESTLKTETAIKQMKGGRNG